MKLQTIFEEIAKQDKQQPLTTSETRFIFVLLQIFNEKADEKGMFCATLNDLCKRYGTSNKNQIVKVRKSLVKKGIIKNTITNGNSSIYEFISSNKNVTTSGNKNVTTSSNKNVTTNEQNTTPFKVVTPLGNVVYVSSKENQSEAATLCNSICSLLMGNEPKQIESFFVFWVKEKNGILLYKTKQNFNVPNEFNKFVKFSI